MLAVVDLLCYRRIDDGLKVPYQVASFFWTDDTDYRSWTGVELQVHRKRGTIEVHTRSQSSRSYWDLLHQNKTLRLIRDLLGGHFRTDAGKNRFWHPDEPAPPPLASGCYLARWRFHNAIGKAEIYLMTRELTGSVARDAPSGFHVMDSMNPRLLSNNMLVPYLLAVWEDYFRSTFVACLKYAGEREAVMKRARLSHSQLEQIIADRTPVEQAIAACFSFQRPSQISEIYALLDRSFDVAGVLRKPYRRRKLSLFESLEQLVASRNAFVHEGDIDLSLYDRELRRTISDVVAAVDRVYAALGTHHGFTPIRDY